MIHVTLAFILCPPISLKKTQNGHTVQLLGIENAVQAKRTRAKNPRRPQPKFHNIMSSATMASTPVKKHRVRFSEKTLKQ